MGAQLSTNQRTSRDVKHDLHIVPSELFSKTWPRDRCENIWKTRYEYIKGSIRNAQKLAKKLELKEHENIYRVVIEQMDLIEMEIG